MNRRQTVINLLNPKIADQINRAQDAEIERARRDGAILALARVASLSHSQRVVIFKEITGKQVPPHQFKLRASEAERRQP